MVFCLIKTMSNIGENLKSLREEAGISIDKLSQITKIQEKYLLRLENNEFEKLPSPVYVRGFIKKWAKACNANADELVLQFQRENENLLEDERRKGIKEVSPPPFIITSKHIILVIVILAAAALAAFFYFNQMLVSEVPQVEIVSPSDFNSVTEEEYIFIRGEAQNTEKIFVNGEEMESGNGDSFEFKFPLNAGLNTIIIRAQSPEGREVETARKVLKL